MAKTETGWGPLPDFNPKKLNRGIHLDIAGLEGQGKTSLALTLARCGAVGYIDIDQSIDRAKRPEGKLKERIKALPIRYSAGLGENASAYRPAWDALQRGVKQAVDWADGVIFDTDTEAWELLRLAEHGTLTPKGRTDKLYGIMNAKFRTIHRDVNRVAGKHLVTIHQLKDDYEDKFIDGRVQSIKTGRHVRAGMKEIGYLADISVRVSHAKNKKGEVIYRATYDICKFNPSLVGMELEDDMVDFATIVSVATGTEAEDWYK